MALDPQLLEILACPDDKGPLLYFEDEDSLYNPRLKRRYAIKDDIPIMLIDEAETVDDAEHDRLLAKAEAAGHPAHLRGVGEPMSGLLDTVGMFDLAAALPEQVAAAADARRRASTASPTHDDDRARRRARAWAAAASPATCWPPSPGPFMPVPVTVVEGLRGAGVGGRGHALLRHLVLGRHRGDRRGGPGRRRGRRAHGRARPPAARSGELARLVGRAPHRAARVPDAAGRASAR